MSIRSLFSSGLGLLAAPIMVMALPHHPSNRPVTVTEYKTVTETAAPACSGSSSVVSLNSTSAAVTPTTTSTSAGISNTIPTTTLVATATATNYGLNDAAKAAGKLWFGTAADIPGTGEAQDEYYMTQFNNTHDFGGATPANIMKVRQKHEKPISNTVHIC